MLKSIEIMVYWQVNIIFFIKKVIFHWFYGGNNCKMKSDFEQIALLHDQNSMKMFF